MNKLKSRKLWIAVSAILASFGTTIAGFSSDSQAIVIAGIICTSVSGAIYSVCETVVDSSYALADTEEESEEECG